MLLTKGVFVASNKQSAIEDAGGRIHARQILQYKPDK
jgi:hypothetical protein